jgi:hypothetical protein
LANAVLGVERDTSLIGYDGQEDIDQSFRMAQTFQEAFADKTMFDPSETAVATADTIGAQNGDVGSHGQEGNGGLLESPSRFVSLTRG